MHYHDIETIEEVFLTCCVLHNMMADDTKMQDTQTWVGCGGPLNQDAINIWQPVNKEAVQESVAVSRSVRHMDAKWNKRHTKLAEHLEFCRRGCGRDEHN